MKELDLYDSPAPSSPEEIAPAAYPEWVTHVWRRFPRAMRERYEPLGVLGEGGMGIVLEARDRVFGRVVAVKGLRDPAGASAETRGRLSREAQLQSRLAHPNVLPVFDVWIDDGGNPWCSMLRVPSRPDGTVPTLGSELRALRARHRLEDRPLSKLLETLLQVCRAVAYAHGQSVLHRDLKPENILLGPSGEALVADWGLAIEARGDTSEAAAEIVGSPPYAAPEQLGALGRPYADKRSDVHGLGAILYEMIAGDAFPSGGAATLPRRVPRELADVVRRATARSPAERFPDVPSFQQALEAYLAGGLVEGMSYTPAERASKWLRSHPMIAGAILTGVLFSAVLLHERWREQRALAQHALELQRQLTESERNLASSHAGWAAVEEAAGHSDEAQAYAALAFETAARVGEGFTLPEGPVHGVFLRRPPASALLWAAKLGDRCGALHFIEGGRKLQAATGKTVYELDLQDTKHPRTLSLPENDLANMELDPRGRFVAITDSATHVTVLGSADRPRRFETGKSVAQPRFSPDGRTLLAGSGNDVQVWDVESGKLRATLRGHTSDLMMIATDRAGERAITADRNSVVKIWDLRTMQPLVELQPKMHVALACSVTADGRTMALAGVSENVKLYRLPDGKPLGELGIKLPFQFAAEFSPDGKLLATGGQDYLVHIWDVATGQERAKLAGHTLWVIALAFSPDGRQLASGGADGVLRIWDVARAQPERKRDEDYVRSMAFSPDGKKVAALGYGGAIRIWDTSSSESVGEATAQTRPVALALGNQGGTIAAGFVGSKVALVRAGEGPAALDFDAGGAPARAVFDRRASRLAVARKDAVVRVLDLFGKTAPVDLRLGAPAQSLAFDGEGSRLATGDTSGEVRIYDIASGRLEMKRPMKGAAASALCFSPDGRALVAGDADGVLTLWTAPSWEGRDYSSHTAPISCIAVSPDGALVATVSGEATYVREFPSGVKIPRLSIPTGTIARAEFSPDGTMLGLAGRGTMEIWDITALTKPAARIRELLEHSFFALSAESGRLEPREPAGAPAPRRLVP